MGIGLTGEIYLQSVMNILILVRVHTFSDGSTGELNWAQTPNLKGSHTNSHPPKFVS